MRLAVALALLSSSCASTETTRVTDAAVAVEAPAAEADETRRQGWGADLAKFVPREADFILAVAGVDELEARLSPEFMTGALQGAVRAMAERFDASPEVLARLAPHVDGLVLFGTRAFKPETSGVIVRFKTLEPVTAALERATLNDLGNGRFGLPETNTVFTVVAEKRVVVISFDDTTETATLDTIASKRRSFGGNSTFATTSMAAPFWFAANLERSFDQPTLFGEGSRLTASLDLKNQHEGSIEVGYAQLGSRVPRLGTVIAPTDQHALRGLPEGPLLAFGFSLRRAPGRAVANVLEELDRIGLSEVKRAVESELAKSAKVSLTELDTALGDSAAVALYAGAGEPDFTRGFFDDAVLLVDVDMRNDAVAKRLIDALGTRFASEAKFSAWSGGFGCTVDEVDLTVQTSPGHIFLTLGNSRVVKDVFARGPLSLGSTARFEQSSKTLGVISHLALFTDLEALKAWLPREGGTRDTKAEAPPAPAKNDANLGASFITIGLEPIETGLSANARGAAGAIEGMLGLYVSGAEGVRRVRNASQARDARRALSKIARGVARAFETPQANGTHRLCAAAPPVPKTVPSGVSYAPSSTAGEDFNHAAWRCIDFTHEGPTLYQYEVRIGGGYKGPARGGPDPGKNGFEVSAEGDLDGDGVTSLQTFTGVVDLKTKKVTLAEKLFINDTLE